MMLILIRGLPYSGKTTVAKELQYLIDAQHFEADQYFTDPKTGEYKFIPRKLPNAHKYCLTQTRHNLSLGHDVIVSNTFTQMWEMEPYFDLAKKFGVAFIVMETHGEYSPNNHNVPEEVIANMKRRWEHYEYSKYSPVDNLIVL